MKERSTRSHTAGNSNKVRPGMDAGFDNVNVTSDLEKPCGEVGTTSRLTQPKMRGGREEGFTWEVMMA